MKSHIQIQQVLTDMHWLICICILCLETSKRYPITTSFLCFVKKYTSQYNDKCGIYCKAIAIVKKRSQGRHRFLESGTAIERHRRSERAEGLRGGGGRAREGVKPPLVRGVRGISPQKIFEFHMSVEAILMHFETILVCKIRLIVQTFHVAVFKCVSNPHQ